MDKSTDTSDLSKIDLQSDVGYSFLKREFLKFHLDRLDAIAFIKSIEEALSHTKGNLITFQARFISDEGGTLSYYVSPEEALAFKRWQ